MSTKKLQAECVKSIQNKTKQKRKFAQTPNEYEQKGEKC